MHKLSRLRLNELSTVLFCDFMCLFVALFEAGCGAGSDVLDMRLRRTDSDTGGKMRRLDFN